MSDLRSQLIAKLGAIIPEPSEDPKGALPGAATLDPEAHLGTPWIALLRKVRVAGAPPVPPKPSLQAARQLTDKAARALKEAGQARAARELVDARADFLKKREKEAWSLVKARFTELELPERTYRALKQSEADPEKLWMKLRKADPAELGALGADRLRERLMS